MEWSSDVTDETLARVVEEAEARERLWEESGKDVTDADLSRAYDDCVRKNDERLKNELCPNELSVVCDSLEGECDFFIERCNERWCRQPRDEWEEKICADDWDLMCVCCKWLDKVRKEERLNKIKLANKIIKKYNKR